MLLALEGQHLRFGQAGVEFGLLGPHARLLVGFVGHVGFGAGELFFSQFQFGHFVGSGANGPGLVQCLFGQADLFIRRRIGCAARQSQNGQGSEKRSNSH
ncbi:hypothetical protein D3C80_1990740 [compost metagenome]